MRKRLKSILASLLSAAMLLSAWPVGALAAPEAQPTEPAAQSAPIADGDQVVLYNPAYKKALSGTYNGFYNNGTDVTLTDGVLSGFTAADVWTVKQNDNDTWSFSYDGKNIAMGDDFSSMPLGEKNDQWALEPAGDGLFYIKNTVRGAYMEWYADKSNWSSYNKIGSGKESLFAMAFYKVTELPEPEPSGELPKAGDQVVLYNLKSEGVLAGQDDNTSPSILSAAASLKDGKASPANGGRVFTVEQNGEWFRFKTEHDGYLCSNGTGSNAFYQKEASDDADWKLAAYNGGFTLESRTAKFKDKYSQYLEFYSDSYKTYSLYSDSEKALYTFQFLPVDTGLTITEGVVNQPAVVFGEGTTAYVGQDCTVTFTVDAVFGVGEGLTARYGENDAVLSNETGTYSFTIPADKLTAGTLDITVSGTDTKGVAFSGKLQLTVVDEPVITAVTPAANAQTGEDLRPAISATFSNAGDAPTAKLTLQGPGGDVVTNAEMTVSGSTASYTLAEDLATGRYTATVTLTRADEKAVIKIWSFTVGTAQYQLYFGQLHSHTGQYSDGAGTLQEGLDHVAGLPDSANVDFVAFTDHSNYFDSTSAPNPEAALYDVGQMTEESRQKWQTYTGDVAKFNEQHAGDVVALAGFEMTWSGGPGHINTFNTPGLVSRNNKTLNDKTADAGMKAYYGLLSNSALSGSISQFNHPGSTFGTFADFAYYDAIIDSRMYLVEVGNGEGAIGSGGYYPSYNYYIMALDKGWHVAPTNNQDNHKGKWGNANDARDVVLTDNFTQEGIYDAIRQYRVYATEDKNLEIHYTLNEQVLGSIIEEVPETANISVNLFDPDGSDATAKVEVVVNTGKVAYTWDDAKTLASGRLSCSIPAEYSYYFIRVTQADGDIAVTAPVWVGDTLKLGISSVECGTSIPVTGEALEIKTTLFNSEQTAATIESITYSMGDKVLDTQKNLGSVDASSTRTVTWNYTPDAARQTTITVAVTLKQDGKEYVYSNDITLDVLDASKLVYVGIDASHYNEYVAGNYKDSMGNFSNLAAGYAVRTVTLKTSEDLKAACANEGGKYKAIILTAPSRRDGNKLRDPYATYSDEEITALKSFYDNGGSLVLAGWSDYYENYGSFPAADHMAAQQNKLLAALGSSLRISDDGTNDDTLNGGQPQRLYLSTYNLEHFLLKGVEFDAEHPNDNKYSQLFSQYGGASIYAVDGEGQPTATLPDTVSPVVYGHATTYSKDSDNDTLGGESVPKYEVSSGDSRLMLLATEQQPGKGLLIVSGAAFLSNFEVQAQVDSAAEKNYSNYTICENLITHLNPVTVTPIAEVQKQPSEGVRYTIEGVVTSNASGYDKDTAFFDCIYLQDGTAGINAFPVAGNFQIGDKVRISGTTSSYQGERQIAVTSITKIGTEAVPAPKEITAAQLNDRSFLGSLVTLRGTVVSYASANGLIQTILVRDSNGDVGRVFIDGYITKDQDVKDLKEGCEITVTGLASYDTSFDGEPARIRVRNRADVVCTEASSGSSSSRPSTTQTTKNPDGSTTTAVKKSDGTVVQTTRRPDGATSTLTTRNGKTTGTVTVPASAITAAKGEPLALPLPTQTAASNEDRATALTVRLAGKQDVAVELPVSNSGYGTVVLRQKADGSQEILRSTVPTKNGVAVVLSDGDTIRIVDRSRTFADVPATHWSCDAIDFVTSRDLFNGTGSTTFSPASPMTRAMVWTVLARLDGKDTTGGKTWYEAGRSWAMEQKISDGSNAEGSITREELVTMLWRYSGSPKADKALTSFTDHAAVSDWADGSMAWAVEQGLVQGSGSKLQPQASASREQVAAILSRFLMTAVPF